MHCFNFLGDGLSGGNLGKMNDGLVRLRAIDAPTNHLILVVFPNLQEVSLKRKVSIKNSLTSNKLESTFEYEVESFTGIKVDEANSVSFLYQTHILGS